MTNPTHHDDHKEQEYESGSKTFGFFHRHQKTIIYTAGLFTLVTFSITGALTGTFEKWFAPDIPLPEMTVPGFGKVKVTKEDEAAARGIVRVSANPFTRAYFAPVGVGKSDNQFPEQMAAVRAIARRAGIDASDNDVDTLLSAAVGSFKEIEGPQQIAMYSGTRDVTRFREWVREALRVSTFLRLAVLGVDTSNDAILRKLAKDHEQLTFDVAYLDSKAYKDGLKKDLEEAALKKFLEEMESAKSDRFREPANRVALRVAMLEPEAFDEKQYIGKEIDAQAQIGDPDIQDYYLRYRETRYKLPEPEKKKEGDKPGDDKKPGDADKGQKPGDAGKPGDGTTPDKKGAGASPQEGEKLQEGETPDAGKKDGPAQDPKKPGDAAGQGDGYVKLDDALKQKIKSRLFAEKVLAAWLTTLDKAMASHMRDVINASMEADIAMEKARGEKNKAQTALDEKGDDAELKKALEAAEKAFEEAEKKAKTAKEAVDARRAEFDFGAEVQKLAAGRPGLKMIAIPEMQDAESLRKHAELGEWLDSHLPGQMTLKGEIYNGRVQNTPKGSFIFQVSDIEARQFKKFEDIKEDVEALYLTEMAEKHSKEHKEKFEKALERLARAKLKEDVEKLEKESSDALEKEFTEWKSGLEKKVESNKALLAQLVDPTLRSYKKTKDVLDRLEADLKKADEKKAEMKKEADKATEEKVDEKLKDAYKDVLAEAAKEGGFEFKSIGPFSRRLSSEPRFQYRHDNVTRAVFSRQAGDADAGDATGLEEDASNEVMYVAICAKVEKGSPKDISRRQWLATRDNSYQSFAGDRMRQAVERSFTIEALEKGYKWQPPEVPDAVAKGKTQKRATDGDKKPGAGKPDDEKPGSKKPG